MNNFDKKTILIKRTAFTLIGLYFFMFLVLMFSYSMNPDKSIIKENIIQAYIQAYQEKDLEKISQLFYRKGSKKYKNFLSDNHNYFEDGQNDALERAESFQLDWVSYNKYEYCERLFINFKDHMGNQTSQSFYIYLTQRHGKIYFSRLIEGWIEENLNSYPEIEQESLTIDDKSIVQYAVKQEDLIHYHTFSDCNNLIIVQFPKNYLQINPDWFANTPRLKEVIIDAENKRFTSVDGVVYNKDITELVYYPRGKIEAEGNNLGELTLPDSVKTIKENAFSYNTGLKKININNVETIQKRAFYQMKYLEQITLNEGLQRIQEQAFSGCQKLSNLSLPNTLTEIGNQSFFDCTRLESVEIKETSALSRIGWAAFENCKRLKQIFLPDGVKKIKNWTFQNCSQLKEISLPKNLEEIGLFAFRDCIALEEFQMPQSIKKVNKGAFYNCQNLNLVIHPQIKTQNWQKSWNLGM